MKKIAGLVAVLACLIGATWFLMRPANVTVQVVLVAGGTDVTDQVRVYAGPISDDADRDNIGFWSIQEIRPIEFEGTRFEVPADTDIAVMAIARGIGTVWQEINVPRGSDETVELALDAGVVNITAAGMPEQGQVRVRDVASDEGIGPEVLPGETLTLYFPAGTHEIEVKQGLATIRERFDVVAGETLAFDFDIGEGKLLLGLETVIPWSDTMPEARIAVMGQDRNAQNIADAQGRVTYSRMPFGTYDATVELGIGGARYVRSRRSVPVPVVVDASETNTVLPLPLLAARLDLSAWDAADLEDADAMVLSMIDLGLPYAAAEVHDAKATLVFFPLEDSGVTETFAIAIAQGNDILAIQEIGALDVDVPLDIVVEKGGDAALCAAITEVANCETLAP